MLTTSQFFEMFGNPIKNEKDWENYKLNEIYEIIDGDRGKNYPKSSDFSNKGFCLFLNAKNVTKEGFKFEETNYISQEKDKSMGKGKLERGDIVLTTRGTLGNLAIYGEKIKYPNIRINSGMVILRKIDKTLEDKYFIEYLKNSRIIEKIKSGTAQPQMPILHLKKIKISVPPIILQNKFATKIEAIQKLKFEIEKSLKETENLYNSLMQKFFSNK
ncbi:restriction endonuclease subunit S [Leptotrichia sp.]